MMSDLHIILIQNHIYPSLLAPVGKNPLFACITHLRLEDPIELVPFQLGHAMSALADRPGSVGTKTRGSLQVQNSQKDSDPGWVRKHSETSQTRPNKTRGYPQRGLGSTSKMTCFPRINPWYDENLTRILGTSVKVFVVVLKLKHLDESECQIFEDWIRESRKENERIYAVGQPDLPVLEEEWDAEIRGATTIWERAATKSKYMFNNYIVVLRVEQCVYSVSNYIYEREVDYDVIKVEVEVEVKVEGRSRQIEVKVQDWRSILTTAHYRLGVGGGECYLDMWDFGYRDRFPFWEGAYHCKQPELKESIVLMVDW
ncbi:hypothetical protein BD779DRAFT_1475300 [Infundibulicybe gibba]|nr:hypothetical protein BD779DRAFT_1475300 [Infundibulicybe gibba]